MWIVNLLPDWIFHLITLGSLIVLAASFVLTAIPFVSTNARAIQAASVIVLIIGIFFEGAIYNNTSWQARVKELELKVARAETQSAEANARLQQELAARQREIDRVRQELTDRIRRSAQEIDAQCRITPTTVNILNDAARGGKK